MAGIESPSTETLKQVSTAPITLERIQEILKGTLPEYTTTSKKPCKPAMGQPSIWLVVNKDFSQCAEVHSYDEVYPGVILGDAKIAMDKATIGQLGVTHILNAAMGQKFNQINTSKHYYHDLSLQFYGINAIDIAGFKLYKFFEAAAEFIENALQSKGKVLVHCQQGLSRSATLVLAFLVTNRHVTLEEAVSMVRKHRPVRPNDGFLKQLCDLNNQLYSRQCVENS